MAKKSTKKPKKQISQGKCALCGKVVSRSGMTKHLKSCIKKKASEKAGRKKGAKAFHLVVEGQYLPEYWMHLEAPVEMTLEDLDEFLRFIWLECCGHLSAFIIQDLEFVSRPFEDFPIDGEKMSIKLRKVLKPGIRFYYKYDFGSTTELALRVISEFERVFDSLDMEILAKNDLPLIVCGKCGEEPAALVCTVCVWNKKGWLCERCAAGHKCGEEMFLPVVNSPRVGVCGYTGD